MFGTFARHVTLGSALVLSMAATGRAQWFGGDVCSPCAAATPVIPAPVAMINPCPCMQPVTQTVYREVPVTTYKPVQKTVMRPVVRTVMEEQPVTAYRTVYEPRTAEVPYTTYQTISECRTCMQDRGGWQTTYQPVPKMTPCQYDPNPTLLGAFNRNMYSMRMAFTPNYTRQRQYVPNVVAYNVPTTRVVAVPGTRQVSYNVAKLEAYQTTRTVAVAKIEQVETTVTAYEPQTEMRTIAVGTSTTMVAMDPFGGGLTASRSAAIEPTPATAAETIKKSAEAKKSEGASGGELWKGLSYPSKAAEEPQPTPADNDGYHDARIKSSPATNEPTPVVQVVGWRPHRPRADETSAPAQAAPMTGPTLAPVSIAAR